ncbi:NUDIX hydrolase [Brevibacillus sp. 179-C9.3 HS]|uniref:NUDIX hydrolase n=1 Tax=unclassified Brevibacillus TaxID=2684853 RepID=UPI00399FEF79
MPRERFAMQVAVHLFLVRGSQVLLLRRYNTGYEDGNYSVPAGHLDGNEEVKKAAIREAKEECGIDIDPSSLEVVGVMHRLSADERIDFFVAASEWHGEIINAEPNKCDELVWMDMDKLPPNVIPYVRQAISNFREQRWFDSFGWEHAVELKH